jgi:hypothetical protein
VRVVYLFDAGTFVWSAALVLACTRWRVPSGNPAPPSPRRPCPRAATSDLVTRVVDRDQFLPAVTGHGDAVDQAEQVVSRLLAIR